MNVLDKPEHLSRADVVYDQLKEAILFRKIAPGTQLIEKIISEKMSVSRTPIRNAIQQLADEGLVKIITNRGAFVVEPTFDEIQQAFDMRRRLEKMSVELLIHDMTQDDFLQLEELIEHEKRTYQKKDILDYLDVNKQFHMFLAIKTKNRFLIDFTERILDQINVYLMLYDVFFDENLDEMKRFKEHEWLVSALKEKDLQKLYKLIDQHMTESLHYMSLDESNK
ncbi:GntR family transcriptional regulator [Halobacillus yeomjeoni]|uniref:GntR family transcriptional regulator n=1 Tax=Halobacillus yeomjeoni TaxID=311194 RepID=A0A931HWY9_9BACI|nr:GntR family transcriptional regulator [Halobacillus yeomjeoni]MBH0231200.1 GntR family transcriptional regulator [Halobacillus yeomjeoni]